MFSDEITNHNMPQNVIIEHCYIYYMESMHRNNEPFHKEKGILCSLAFGFDFNQQKYSANVTLINTNITNVSSQNLSLIFILFNSSNASFVTIFNSNFSKNNMHDNSIIKILKGIVGSCKLSYAFKIKNCTLSYNTAKSIFFIYQAHYSKTCHVKMHIKVILTVFAHNEMIGTFWKAEFNTNHKNIEIIFILIKHCSFVSLI